MEGGSIDQGNAEFGGLPGLGAGIGADHHVVRLLRHRAGHLGAERLGPSLGLAARHVIQDAGEAPCGVADLLIGHIPLPVRV